MWHSLFVLFRARPLEDEAIIELIVTPVDVGAVGAAIAAPRAQMLPRCSRTNLSWYFLLSALTFRQSLKTIPNEFSSVMSTGEICVPVVAFGICLVLHIGRYLATYAPKGDVPLAKGLHLS